MSLDYYDNAGVLSHYRGRKILPKAKGACLVVTSINMPKWKTDEMELEDAGWQIIREARDGATPGEVIVEFTATHEGLPRVDGKPQHGVRGINPPLEDDTLMGPAFDDLKKKIARLQPPRRA